MREGVVYVGDGDFGVFFYGEDGPKGERGAGEYEGGGGAAGVV